MIQRRNWPTPLKEWEAKEKKELAARCRSKDFLEVGCGEGAFLKSVVIVAKSVTGIEKSQHMVQIAQKKLAGTDIRVLQQNVKRLEFPNHSFDLIACTVNTFGNMTPTEKIRGLREMYRVLRPKGQIWITVYAENGYPCQIEHYQRIGLTGIRVTPNFVTTNEGFKSERFTPQKLEMLLNQAGLRGTITKFSEVSYLCVIKKGS